MTIDGVDYLLDYAHNPHAYKSLLQLVGRLGERRRIVVFDVVGDRRDEDIEEVCGVLAPVFDAAVIYEAGDLRGRAPGELMDLQERFLTAAGFDAAAIERVARGAGRDRARRGAGAAGRPRVLHDRPRARGHPVAARTRRGRRRGRRRAAEAAARPPRTARDAAAPRVAAADRRVRPGGHGPAPRAPLRRAGRRCRGGAHRRRARPPARSAPETIARYHGVLRARGRAATSRCSTSARAPDADAPATAARAARRHRA